MTNDYMKNVKHTLNASILMQIALEQLECITIGQTPFVRENKMKLNNTVQWLERQSETITNVMDAQELQLYVELTDKLRKIIGEFNVQSK